MDPLHAQIGTMAVELVEDPTGELGVVNTVRVAMREALTTDRVKEHFAAVCEGRVTRYELPNLRALNFILGNSLAGGGSGSMRTDAQGKTFGRGLLFMEIEVPDDFAG